MTMLLAAAEALAEAAAELTESDVLKLCILHFEIVQSGCRPSTRFSV